MNQKIIKVFLASPSKLERERKCVKDAIIRLNSTIGIKLDCQLQLSSWEHSVYSDVGSDAQDVINRQISDDYDIFIGLLWDRIGTPTKRSLSGTIEEYERAFKQYTFVKKPIIMMYFKDIDSSMSGIDQDQVQWVNEFKERVSRNGSLYYSFTSIQDFSHMIYDHLSMAILDFDKRNKIIQPTAKDYILHNSKYFFENKKESCSVAIVYRSNVLLVRRSMKLRVGGGLWQLPGGKIETNETPLNAIIRECSEELGISIIENELKYITSINAKSLGDSSNTSMTIHLYVYEVERKLTDIILEDSIDKIKWISLDQLNPYTDEFLGSTYDSLYLVKRYIFAYSPLKSLVDHLEGSNNRLLPSRLGQYSEETSQVLFSIMSVLGFINEKDITKTRSDETMMLLKILLEWSITDRGIFEPDGHSDWQMNMLLLNSGEKLLDYQKTLFEKHESLSALMSYKLSKVLSKRNVCDLLIFGTISGHKYILLRWDYFAEKFQIPSKGLEKLEYVDKTDKKIAEFVIRERLSYEIIPAFDYEYINTFSTTHLSSGSIDNIKLIRNYDIFIFSLKIKDEMVKRVMEVIYSHNKRTSEIMKNCNISKTVHKDTTCFIWADFQELIHNQYTYMGRRVQGFAEILDFIGKDTVIKLSESSTDLTQYTEYIETDLV